jgi:hypothetical protein
MRRILNLALATVAAGLVTASPADAAETTCVGFITGVHDNVVVPPGAACTIGGATVLGNVKALRDSTLFTFSSTIRGNIDGDQAEVFQILAGTRVGGNVAVKEGETDNPIFDVALCGTTVAGSVYVEKMVGEVLMGGVPGLCPNTFRQNVLIQDNFLVNNGLDININSVGQNLQVFKNRGPAPKLIFGNTVGEALQCFENDPPFVGGPNVAQQEQGQCF